MDLSVGWRAPGNAGSVAELVRIQLRCFFVPPESNGEIRAMELVKFYLGLESDDQGRWLRLLDLEPQSTRGDSQFHSGDVSVIRSECFQPTGSHAGSGSAEQVS